MTREEAIRFIYESLEYVYCGNCRYLEERDYAREICETCHLSSSGWEISMKRATELADRIFGEVKP